MHKTTGMLLLLLCTRAVAATDTRTIDRVMTEAMAAWKIPGAAVVVVKDDRVVHVKGYGVKEIGSSDAVTADTLFQLASTTKAFTTTAMAILVDEKKMTWDDPVRKHVDYFRLADPCADLQVTLRDIVSHRTGLRRHDELWDNTPLTRADVVRRIGSVKLTKPFRSTYQYQNIMFITAGEAIAAASGTSWDDFVRTRLFEPLGMTRTRIAFADWHRADHASGHRYDDKKDQVSPRTAIDDTNVGAAGAIKSTARDMGQWLRLQLGNGMIDGKRVVSAEALGETKMPQTVIRLEGSGQEANPESTMQAYGLGWVIQDYRGDPLVSHAGALNGFRAHVDLLPRQNAGFAVLINVGRSFAATALRNTLTDLLLNKPSRDWNAYYMALEKKGREKSAAEKREREAKRHQGTRPSRELAAYAGTYEHPAYGSATVVLEKEKLVVRWNHLALPLEHVHFDTFSAVSEADEVDEAVTFRLNAKGDVSEMTLFGEAFVK